MFFNHIYVEKQFRIENKLSIATEYFMYLQAGLAWYCNFHFEARNELRQKYHPYWNKSGIKWQPSLWNREVRCPAREKRWWTFCTQVQRNVTKFNVWRYNDSQFDRLETIAMQGCSFNCSPNVRNVYVTCTEEDLETFSDFMACSH